MRALIQTLVTFVLLPAALTAQSTIQVTSFPSCWEIDNNACLVIYPMNAPGHVAAETCTFQDPLPAIARVTNATLTMSAQKGDPYPVSSTWPASRVTVALNSVSMGGGIYSTKSYDYCAAPPSSFPTASFPSGIPGYVPGDWNTFTITIADGTLDMGHVQLALTYEIPPPIEFEINSSEPESNRRILISNPRLGTPESVYPKFQKTDARVSTYVRARNTSDVYTSGTVIYLRVVDPPDTAAYMNLTSNPLAYTGDNRGAPPLLDGPGVTLLDPILYPGIYRATTNTEGKVSFDFLLQRPYVGGDNYQIEASFNPTFPPASSWNSETLTVWKRVFVEKRRMLRNGMFISRIAMPGDTSIVVRGNRYNGNRGRDRLSAGDTIALVHSPQRDRSDALSGWYSEVHTILSVIDLGAGEYRIQLGTRSKARDYPETLAHGYAPDSSLPEIGDGIARIDGPGIALSDMFDASNDLVTGSVFPGAFVEYLYLPDSSSLGADVPIPYYRSSTEKILQALADRWSSIVSWTGTRGESLPNHQLLIIGASSNTLGAISGTVYTGLTMSKVPYEESSYVFRETIEELVRSAGTGDPDRWSMKTCAHEIAHQWKTNTLWAFMDHCPETSRSFDDSVYCLLAASSPTGADSERSNGTARFHLRREGTIWHSEYLEIRTHADPYVPAP